MFTYISIQSSGAVWKSRWPSWAPVPNKPTVSVDVKQHFNNTSSRPSLKSHMFFVDVKHHERKKDCLLLKCCFTSTETEGLLGTGAQDVHLHFHTAPELWERLHSQGATGGQVVSALPQRCCPLSPLWYGPPPSPMLLPVDLRDQSAVDRSPPLSSLPLSRGVPPAVSGWVLLYV